VEAFQYRLRFTIGTKLVGLIAILLMGSIVSLVWLSTRMFVESDTALIQQENADAAASLATQMRESLQSSTDKMRILGTFFVQFPHPSEAKNKIISEFFSKDKDFLAVFLAKAQPHHDSTFVSKAISPEMISLEDPTGERALSTLLRNREVSLNSVSDGEVQITTTPLSTEDSAMVLAIPFLQDPEKPSRFTHILIALIRQSHFLKAFSESNVVTSYMVDRHGRVLAHPETDLARSREDFSDSLIVKRMLEGKFNNGQTRYIDPRSGEAKLGAYRMVGFAGLGVAAEVAEAKAFEAARKVEYRASLIAWIVLCLSFWAGYLYSGTITWPIRRLSDAARRISEGDFKIQLKARGRDEIAHLSSTFNEMAKGLEERDRVKETFNKFHNKEIAEKLLSGEVKLGGERKEATVFFSDVRGFTALSESMEPEQVVEMLNEYMTRMVSVIRSYGGVVDKYVGDAIMALWGVPLTGPDDVYQAIRACLGMREELAKLNELRLTRNQPVLKIGMGLNMGPLIAGNIGSNEKMEYTVIGDAVNLASRIESMTKEYGTDFLISKSVYEKVKDRIICETCKATRVKGKADAIEVFKVLGFYDEQNRPVTIETPYSSYTAEKSDKVVHEAPHEEEKSAAPPTPPLFNSSLAQPGPFISSSGLIPPPFKKNSPAK
jgi:adenylate cyclase